MCKKDGVSIQGLEAGVTGQRGDKIWKSSLLVRTGFGRCKGRTLEVGWVIVFGKFTELGVRVLWSLVFWSRKLAEDGEY